MSTTRTTPQSVSTQYLFFRNFGPFVIFEFFDFTFPFPRRKVRGVRWGVRQAGGCNAEGRRHGQRVRRDVLNAQRVQCTRFLSIRLGIAEADAIAGSSCRFRQLGTVFCAQHTRLRAPQTSSKAQEPSPIQIAEAKRLAPVLHIPEPQAKSRKPREKRQGAVLPERVRVVLKSAL